MTIPVIAGKGKKLFSGGETFKKMKLVSSVATPTGTVISTYEPRR